MIQLILLAVAAGSVSMDTPRGHIVAPVQSPAATAPRIRIVPQSSDTEMVDIEESFDGSRLLTHNRGYAPRLWDARKQILLTLLTGHNQAVEQVNFSPDGKRIVTLSRDQLRVWDSERAKSVAIIQAPAGESFTCESISGDLVSVGSTTGKVRLYSVAEVDKPTVLGTHTAEVTELSFSPDGKIVFSGSKDGTGRAWDAIAKTPLWQASGHTQPIRWAKYSADSSMVLVTSMDNKATLYKVAGGEKLKVYPQIIAERSMVGNIESGAGFVGKNGDEVATGQANGDINISEAVTGKLLHKFEGHKAAVREMRISFNHRYIGTYADDGTLKVWDTFERKEIPIDLDDGNPMAGSFSPKDDVFWLGYGEGEIHRHDLTKGGNVKSTYGSVVNLSAGEVAPNGSTLWMRGSYNLFGSDNRAKNLILDGTGVHRAPAFYGSYEEMVWQPKSEAILTTSRVGDDNLLAFGFWSNISLFSAKILPTGMAWAPDSKHAAVILDNDIYDIDATSGKVINQFTWPTDKEQGDINAIAFHPNGVLVATAGHPNHLILLWDIQTGKKVRSLGSFDQIGIRLTFLDGGKKLFIHSWSESTVIDTTTAKVIWKRATDPTNTNDETSYKISADQNRIAYATTLTREVVDANTGKSIFKIKTEATSSPTALDMNHDGSLLVTSEGITTTVWDVATGLPKCKMTHVERVIGANFAANGSRIISFDRQGAEVWNLNADHMASIVLMENGDWLVYDDKGRYDASDANDVTGAYFIVEWEHGLEPIAMPQLKTQFYEPGLLGKALGLDKDALRDVPSLESLKLYPDLTVKATDKPFIYDIQAKDRDDGGVGRLNFYLNGKLFYSKKGSEYIQLDLNSYLPYLLPETSLKNGAGNQLSVTVTNENGDLTSAPVITDVGVPKELKAPDIHLRALFVGVGDYPGSAGDLVAPPEDAAALSSAIKTVGEKLLPGKMDITVLGTGEGQERPTRTNIMKWFEQTSTKSSSSDIVMVFFAGHGMSKIGDKSDYFFLTSEADPSDITPSVAATATISGEDLRQALAKIPANKQVVILDTCHSGAATSTLLGEGRSVSGDYQRAWESIRDTTGTWLLAGSASDQLSYESSNVDHGMLTYALLEAIDKGSADGLRKTPSGEMFVDVERWLGYAANRVESLKSEVGVKGVQQPEFRRATKGSSFDIGVVSADGIVGLRPPKPVVILGTFQADEEDPLGLEPMIHEASKDVKDVKFWYEVPKHPNVYRAAGVYSVAGDKVTLKLYIQKFDADQNRKTIDTVEMTGDKNKLGELATAICAEVQKRIQALEQKPEKP